MSEQTELNSEKAMNKNIEKLVNDFIERINVHDIVQAKEGGVIYLSSILLDFERFIKKETKGESIKLTETELRSGLTRQKRAERLIIKLPRDYDGRNNWLLNYGYNSEEAAALRREKGIKWNEDTQAAETTGE